MEAPTPTLEAPASALTVSADFEPAMQSGMGQHIPPAFDSHDEESPRPPTSALPQPQPHHAMLQHLPCKAATCASSSAQWCPATASAPAAFKAPPPKRARGLQAVQRGAPQVPHD